MSKISKKYKRLKEQAANLSPRMRLVIVIGAALVVVIVIAGILILLSGQNKLSDDSGFTEAQKQQRELRIQQSKRDGAILDSAKVAIDKGDTAQADEVYKTAIQSEQDTTRKIKLHIDQSGLLYGAGKVQEAIDAAKKAEGLSDDKYLVADWLSRIYEDQKQYKLAAEYYTLSGQWADSPNNLAKLTKSYYDGEATRVLALAGKS